MEGQNRRVARRSFWLLPRLGVLVVLLGCGSTRAGDGGVDGGEEEPASAELVVELSPLERRVLPGVFTKAADAADPVVLRAEHPLSVALGPEYPAALTVDLGKPFGCEDFDAFEIRSIEGDATSFVKQVSPTELRITPSAEGEYSVRVQGVIISPPEGTASYCAHRAYGQPEVAFELNMPLKVRRPITAAITWPLQCAEAETQRLASGADLRQRGVDRLRVYAVDSEGERFHPANADERRPVTVTVRGSAQTALQLADEEEGLSSLIATGPDDELTFSAFDEAIASAELVARSRIDAALAAFGLQALKGSGVALQSGESYGAEGWSFPGIASRLTGSIDVAVRAEYVGGAPLCTAPPRDAFSLSSATADVCSVVNAPGHGDYSAGSSYVYLDSSVDVVADGTCTLELHAPDYAGGDGWSTALSVELVNVEDLSGPKR